MVSLIYDLENALRQIIYLFCRYFNICVLYTHSMWVVVNFTIDNSVEAVPSTWYNDGTCAWPNKTINAVRAIQKRTLPYKLEFKWLNARKLGSMSGNYILNYNLYDD